MTESIQTAATDTHAESAQHAPLVTTTIAQYREELAKRLAQNPLAPVVLVPTMGALHAGHISLVEKAQDVAEDAIVVVSIFVNPLQFAEGEDLDAYPRTLDKDVEKLSDTTAQLVFAPSPREMYPAGPRTMIHPGETGTILEGESRPTHFAGVLTVVNKLFQISTCTHAVFGEKDYQQLLLIKQMVRDLNMDIDIIGAPIVREESGLAKSSRNQYLSAEQATLATALSRALNEAAKHTTQADVLATAEMVLAEHPEIKVDYLALKSSELSDPAPGANRLLVAARVGTTRLIDNVAVTLN